MGPTTLCTGRRTGLVWTVCFLSAVSKIPAAGASAVYLDWGGAAVSLGPVQVYWASGCHTLCRSSKKVPAHSFDYCHELGKSFDYYTNNTSIYDLHKYFKDDR